MAGRVVTVAFDGVEPGGSTSRSSSCPAIRGSSTSSAWPTRRWPRAGSGCAGPSRASAWPCRRKRIIANLAPADLPKEGSHFDLPIALALLAAMGVIPPDALSGWAAMGELALDGRIAPVAGALPAAVAAGAMGLGLICPEAYGPEAAWAGEVRCWRPGR